MKEKRWTRREFISKAIKTAAAALLFPVLFKASRSAEGADAKKKKSAPESISLNLEDDTYGALRNAGGAAYIKVKGESQPVIVHRTSDTEVAAFSSRCSHAGCRVSLPENGTVVCKCHNSVFDANGRRQSGPASRDLKEFSARLEGNSITITSL